MGATGTWTIKINRGVARLEMGKVRGLVTYRIVEQVEGAEVVTHEEPLAGRSYKQVERALTDKTRAIADRIWLATH